MHKNSLLSLESRLVPFRRILTRILNGRLESQFIGLSWFTDSCDLLSRLNRELIINCYGVIISLSALNAAATLSLLASEATDCFFFPSSSVSLVMRRRVGSQAISRKVIHSSHMGLDLGESQEYLSISILILFSPRISLVIPSN